MADEDKNNDDEGTEQNGNDKHIEDFTNPAVTEKRIDKEKHDIFINPGVPRR
jgi:hypothetical protein